MTCSQAVQEALAAASSKEAAAVSECVAKAEAVGVPCGPCRHAGQADNCACFLNQQATRTALEARHTAELQEAAQAAERKLAETLDALDRYTGAPDA